MDTKIYMTDEEMIGILGALLCDDDPDLVDLPEKARKGIYDVYAGLCARVNQW